MERMEGILRLRLWILATGFSVVLFRMQCTKPWRGLVVVMALVVAKVASMVEKPVAKLVVRRKRVNPCTRNPRVIGANPVVKVRVIGAKVTGANPVGSPVERRRKRGGIERLGQTL